MLTVYFAHAKRGRDAVAAVGLLAFCRGILVHDHWAVDATYTTCRHALCNAHHRRELVAIAAPFPQLTWPQRMIALQCAANAAVAARAAGRAPWSAPVIEDFRQRYADLLDQGERRHPRRDPP